MRIASLIISTFFSWMQIQADAQSHEVPKLVKNGNHFQLIVDNKPFLILGGELGNSSASSNNYMRSILKLYTY